MNDIGLVLIILCCLGLAAVGFQLWLKEKERKGGPWTRELLEMILVGCSFLLAFLGVLRWMEKRKK